MNIKHTKGKWTIYFTDFKKSGTKGWWVMQGTKIICKLQSYNREDPKANIEEKANAKLIAAAPKLLQALRYAYGSMIEAGVEGDLGLEPISEALDATK